MCKYANVPMCKWGPELQTQVSQTLRLYAGINESTIQPINQSTFQFFPKTGNKYCSNFVLYPAMNEEAFYHTIHEKSRELNLNPLLLLSGIEGLYTFRDVQLNAINYDFLDSLILTIFALRIGDQFHTLAEENLASTSDALRLAAARELTPLSMEEITASQNSYLQSFAQMLQGKSPVRRYHEKALEVAALEIRKAQLLFSNNSIGIIMLAICKDDEGDSLGLGSLFRA
jgi:hypothetical protein